MNYKIRPMLKTDHQEVLRIIAETAEFTDEEKRIAGELVDSYLEKGESSGYIICVAQVNFMVAGYICFGPTPLTASAWDIYWIAVGILWQRSGLGRALLHHAEKEVIRYGGTMIIIETSSKDTYLKTRRFYESLGYAVIASIPDFYSAGDDKVIFHRKLNTDVQI